MADIMSTYLANFIRSGNPNGNELPTWPRAGVQPNFIRFADGQAAAMTTAPFPTRDAINRRVVLKQFELDEVALSGN